MFEKGREYSEEEKFLLYELADKIEELYGWKFIIGEEGSGDYWFIKNDIHLRYSSFNFDGFYISKDGFNPEKVLNLSELMEYLNK